MNVVRENEKKSCALLKEEKGNLVEWTTFCMSFNISEFFTFFESSQPFLDPRSSFITSKIYNHPIYSPNLMNTCIPRTQKWKN